MKSLILVFCFLLPLSAYSDAKEDFRLAINTFVKAKQTWPADKNVKEAKLYRAVFRNGGRVGVFVHFLDNESRDIIRWMGGQPLAEQVAEAMSKLKANLEGLNELGQMIRAFTAEEIDPLVTQNIVRLKRWRNVIAEAKISRKKNPTADDLRAYFLKNNCLGALANL